MPSEHDRFWSKVAITGDSECWTWQRMKHRQGYGMFSVSGKMKYAHRIAWEATNGPIPEGMHVLHKCDNPPCCNPAHLFLGTHGDNMRDMNAKGRRNMPKGEASGSAKVSDSQVAEIRRLYATGRYTQVRLAEMFGVHQTHISLLVTGKVRV